MATSAVVDCATIEHLKCTEKLCSYGAYDQLVACAKYVQSCVQSCQHVNNLSSDCCPDNYCCVPQWEYVGKPQQVQNILIFVGVMAVLICIVRLDQVVSHLCTRKIEGKSAARKTKNEWTWSPFGEGHEEEEEEEQEEEEEEEEGSAARREAKKQRENAREIRRKRRAARDGHQPHNESEEA